ncbi:MAG: alkaline phosphatase family protein [Gaiellales bacterium]
MKRTLMATCALALTVVTAGRAGAPTGPVPAAASTASPITHVVSVYQENHSFDNVLGRLCVLQSRCNGVTTGLLPTGITIPLSRATDLVPPSPHTGQDQITAIDGGRMDGFANLKMCARVNHYSCYTQFAPSQIPNLASLAEHFTISDQTFEMDTIPSWGAHMELAAATLDGFDTNPGVNPFPSTTGALPLPGWGCESDRDNWWGSPKIAVPACVPDYSLDPLAFPYGGAYRSTPVASVPTIMDRMDAAGLTWGIYAGSNVWAVCPTFAQCQYTSQKRNQHPASAVLAAAAAGTLPNLSIVTPTGPDSQHNGFSMLQGDNWIGQVVSAVMSGPDWASTAIFITYDDCGCFYDHVKTPPGMGIRVPMVIVSPYARPRYTDSTTASFASMLAFVEHNFRLYPLTSADAGAYDYSHSFNFSQHPLAPVPLATHPVPRSEQLSIARHPPDLTADPT